MFRVKSSRLLGRFKSLLSVLWAVGKILATLPAARASGRGYSRLSKKMQEFIDQGKEFGFEGDKLLEFVRQQQDRQRDERQWERERKKEELELQIRLEEAQQAPIEAETGSETDHGRAGRV